MAGSSASLQRHQRTVLETRARLALASQIGGVNTDVVRLRAELGNAQWELEQTTVRAPTDGYVTNLALRKGARVTAATRASVETRA